jgi:hypothetical protein
MLIGHKHSLEHYWTQKWLIQDEMKAIKRKQNKLEPEFDCEHWPWAETVDPVIDPHAPIADRHPLDVALLGLDQRFFCFCNGTTFSSSILLFVIKNNNAMQIVSSRIRCLTSNLLRKRDDGRRLFLCEIKPLYKVVSSRIRCLPSNFRTTC